LTRRPARFKHPFMAIDPRYELFGEAMAFRRRQLKLKQSELAGRVGLSRASIANIECGRQNVQLHHAYDIAAALGVQVADLLPPDVKPSLEDQSLVLSDAVSPKAKAQISDLIANAVASAQARS
jgi:transcriptional regulator with XRE-family HTH domain